MLNFKILSKEKISEQFLKFNIHDFVSASEFVKNLPYKRNGNKENERCIFNDNGGTCSTKHALLKRLADENGFTEIKLILGIFRMNSQNTPKISTVLKKYSLKEIPEAHNYLKYQNRILDFTQRNSNPEDFINDLVEEIEIEPNQITDFKINYHKVFIKNYLEKKTEILFNHHEFWKIREECISALQK